MSGFDHKCPYCEAEIDVRQAWESHDYSSDFRTECGNCQRTVQVDVCSEPVFETSRLMCQKCSRGELESNSYYCNKCLDEIRSHKRVYRDMKESQ